MFLQSGRPPSPWQESSPPRNLACWTYKWRGKLDLPIIGVGLICSQWDSALFLWHFVMILGRAKILWQAQGPGIFLFFFKLWWSFSFSSHRHQTVWKFVFLSSAKLISFIEIHVPRWIISHPCLERHYKTPLGEETTDLAEQCVALLVLEKVHVDKSEGVAPLCTGCLAETPSLYFICRNV